MEQDSYTLYGDHRSGNCYKPALMMSLAGIPFRWVETNVLMAETRTPEFLTLNPNGRVPLLQLPDGSLLSESNAMLMFLAQGTDCLPEDRYQNALVAQWLFFEQYSHEPYIAVARFLLHFDHGMEIDEDRMTMLHERGLQALAVMETALSENPFIAGDSFTIADIALYAYTHVAADGGFDTGAFKTVSKWLDRVAGLPGHFDLDDIPR